MQPRVTQEAPPTARRILDNTPLLYEGEYPRTCSTACALRS